MLNSRLLLGLALVASATLSACGTDTRSHDHASVDGSSVRGDGSTASDEPRPDAHGNERVWTDAAIPVDAPAGLESSLQGDLATDASPLADATSWPDLGPCGLVVCDDHNPCTEDQLGADCHCVHQPTPEGQRCDDLDPCTQNDRCVSGACRGEARSSHMEVMSSVRGYGEVDSTRGRYVLLPGGRAVYASGYALSLLSTDGERVELLDRRKSLRWVASDRTSGNYRPRSFLLDLGEGRVAFVWSDHGADIYDVSTGKFIELNRYSDDETVFGAAARDGTMWTCFLSTLTRRTIDAQGLPRAMNPFSVSGAGVCHDLSLAPDNKSLWMATTKGLYAIDITDPASPKGLKALLTDKFVLDVRVSDDFVALREVLTNDGYSRQVRVLRRDTYEDVLTIKHQGTKEVPVAFEFVGKTLIVQRTISENGCASNLADVYVPDGHGFRLARTRVVREGCGISIEVPPSVSGDNRTIVGAYSELVQLNAAGDDFTYLSGRFHGPHGRYVSLGSDIFASASGAAMHLLNLSDPRNPVVLGRQRMPDATHAWSFLLRNGGLPTTPTGYGQIGKASLVWLDGTAMPTVAGSIRPVTPNSQWTGMGRVLVRVEPASSSGYDIERIDTSTFTRDGEQAIHGSMSPRLTAEASPGFTTRQALRTAMDPSNGDIVIAEVFVNPGPPAVRETVVTRARWHGSEYVRVSSASLPFAAEHFRTLRGESVVASLSQITLVSSDGTIVRSMERPSGEEITSIGVVGAMLYLVVLPVGSKDYTLVAVHADTLADVDRLPNFGGGPGGRGMVGATGQALLVASGGDLLLVSPTCP
jgi:hypothetical protein